MGEFLARKLGILKTFSTKNIQQNLGNGPTNPHWYWIPTYSPACICVNLLPGTVWYQEHTSEGIFSPLQYIRVTPSVGVPGYGANIPGLWGCAPHMFLLYYERWWGLWGGNYSNVSEEKICIIVVGSLFVVWMFDKRQPLSSCWVLWENNLK